MKRSVYKRLRLYPRLLWINTVTTWRTDTAYFGNGWGGVLSTVAYTLTFILFISVIFANVHAIAGYSRDQILFLSFLGQASYYGSYIWTWNNTQQLIDSVNRGSFDLLLVKPIPSLFYTSVRSISIVPQLRDGLPSLFFLALAINWHAVTLSWATAAVGLVIMVAGQFAINAFAFFLSMPVFWFGQANDSLTLGYSMFGGTDFPYEGIPGKLRLALIYIVPVLISATLAASVMLGKLPAPSGLAIALSATAILVTIKILLWRLALRNYTSASS